MKELPETEFQALVKTVIDSGVNIHDITKEFSVSCPTVYRWAEGRSRPHPAVRAPIVAYLRSRLRH
jgi:transposase